MAVCPFAIVEMVPVGNHQAITPSAVIVHSNAGNSGDLYEWWLTNPDGLQSHFQVTYDGTIYQYVDTAVAAYANVQANQYAISIESANSPNWNAIGFDNDLWSPAQLAAITKLCKWIESVHPAIPTHICSDGVHGYGWHDEYADWTTPGHVCPGAAREQQFIHTLVPAIAGAVPPEDDMFTADDRQLLVDVKNFAHNEIPNISNLVTQAATIEGKLDRLLASNTRIEASERTEGGLLARIGAKFGVK